ncbi:hypothetical protein AOQ84DRAFT_353272 [Glonium stellatum]|uniref:Uncharacterized protein n=1 Tax=Glonium stellatum TaxID=574774 RepID=A0A8E2F5K5_9PEZI|nr:hypothetical protein AOQ84DRAFT_353272 [Glonium stellatum]
MCDVIDSHYHEPSLKALSYLSLPNQTTPSPPTSKKLYSNPTLIRKDSQPQTRTKPIPEKPPLSSRDPVAER